MALDSHIDVKTMQRDGLLLDVYSRGKRTRVRLSRRSCQQLAVVLAATAGAPSSLYERGIRLNLSRARHVPVETIDVPEPASSGASRAIGRGAIVPKIRST